MRQIIIGILAIAIVAGAVYGARKLSGNRKHFETVEKKRVPSVFTEEVENSNSSIKIVTSGQLVAKNKMNLYSEVQGIFETGGREFKPGVHYKKGDLLIKINSEEYYASLQAQKSTLYNQVVAIMPDLRLDYPESFDKWDKYVREFDLDAKVKPLPEPVNEREKLFVSGRNLYTTYYNVQNLQRKYEKYSIYAPYSGVVTEALVQPGTLVRPGQALGEYIDQSAYELEAAVNIQYMEILRIGKPVTLQDIRHNQKYQGKVIRINGKVEQATQTITVFIQVSDTHLKEGMYLEAELEAQEEAETFEISRKLLLENNRVFIVNDNTLQLAEVEPIYFNERTIIVRGLVEGVQLVSRPIPGGYPGMEVRVMSSKEVKNED
jgi:multidrug efflux pump subunit AcrA (membrane-fusion protein)